MKSDLNVDEDSTFIKITDDLDNIEDNYIKHGGVFLTTMNVGIINGGSGKNSVSAFCKVTIDFRIIDSNHINKIETI